MKSERTKKCIKLKRLYICLSWFLCFGTFIIFLIVGIAIKWHASETSEAASHIKALLGLGITSILPVILLSILVKDKIKPTIRMLNVIFAAYLVANWFMYLVGAVMLIDCYIISGLIERYKTAVISNREMDKRDGANDI